MVIVNKLSKLFAAQALAVTSNFNSMAPSPRSKHIHYNFVSVLCKD